MTTALLRPLAAATRWQPIAGATLVVAVALPVKIRDLSEPDSAVATLRFVAIILASSACFVVDDDAADVLASSPATLVRRRLLRIGVGAGLVAVPWAFALSAVESRGIGDIPVLAMTFELATLLVVGVAAAVALERWRGLRDPGVAASPLVFVLALLASRLPERWALFAPAHNSWTAAHLRWAVLLAAGALLFAWCTRDPAARSLVRRPPAHLDRAAPQR